MLGLCKVAQQPYEVGTSCEEKMQPLAYQDVVAILAT
jgi:hypothetical protein